MRHIKTIAEAEELLAEYVPLQRTITGKQVTLERMRPLMAALGNPQQRLKIIHVAGTSGKTSTCYYIASLLMSTGRRVGLTVSPHIDTVRERLQIDLEPLSETEFISSLNEFMLQIEKSSIQPTYFELLVAFAYWYFDKSRVDYAVIETGLGGSHDGTNVADNADKVCVITDIGLDHMHVLGRTAAEISRQKAGIVHASNEVFIHAQPDEIMDEIEGRVEQVSARLHVAADVFDQASTGNGLPDYQRRNWTLAKSVFDFIQQRDNLPAADTAKSMQTVIPARMDTVKAGNKLLIMDGAHNEQKTQALVGSFAHMYPGVKADVVVSLKQGKEFMAVLPLLRPITKRLIVTAFSRAQDLPAAPIDPGELAAAAKRFGFEDVVTEPDPAQAYSLALAGDNSTVLITGSFYLIGQLRAEMGELAHA